MAMLLGGARYFPLVDPGLARKNARAIVAQKKDARRALVAFHAKSRQAAKKRRTPPWANMDAIRRMYELAVALEAETGVPHHVDHVIPLQGRLVSGLHVETNLQVIPARDNLRKHNSFAV